MTLHTQSIIEDAGWRKSSQVGTIDLLLIDDQLLLARTVADMLRNERDIRLFYCGDPRYALTQAVELSPAMILLDLQMPQQDGLVLLRQLRSDRRVSKVPIVVLTGRDNPETKAKAFALGADDYVIKLPSSLELLARIRHHAGGYLAGRDQAKRTAKLFVEIAEGADYLRSLLPEPISHGPVRIDWRFAPSSQLGGDAFGYRWLNKQSLAIYLIDVMGHGLGASLMAVSVLNALNRGMLIGADFFDPSSVLHGLNWTFRRCRQPHRYFTIWYGVYDCSKQILRFSSGGHPPPLLFSGNTGLTASLCALPRCGPPVAMFYSADFEEHTIHISDSAKMLLYTDGVAERHKSPIATADHELLREFVSRLGPVDDLLDQVMRRALCRYGDEPLDDCSLMQIDFIPNDLGESR